MPPKKKLLKRRKPQAPVSRMVHILSVHRMKRHETARYMKVVYKDLFARIFAISKKADTLGSWGFMNGCFYQAVEVYAVAAIAYEKYASPIMSDATFDGLAKFLHRNYEQIPDTCKSEYMLNPDIFRAGSGMHFVNNTVITPLRAYMDAFETCMETGVLNERTKHKPRLLREKAHKGVVGRKVALRRKIRRPR